MEVQKLLEWPSGKPRPGEEEKMEEEREFASVENQGGLNYQGVPLFKLEERERKINRK